LNCKEIGIFFSGRGAFFILKIKQKTAIERTGKNITNRIREPPDSGLFTEDDPGSFSGYVIHVFPIAGYAQRSREAIWY
jgi:hypothetical protein